MQRLAAVLISLTCVVAATEAIGGSCRDQYKNCPGWSTAGYCQRPFYNSFMKLMCAYSCDTCDGELDTSTSEGSASASGDDEAQSTQQANQKQPLGTTSQSQQTASTSQDTTHTKEPEAASGDDEAQSTQLANQMQRFDTTSQSEQTESTNQDTTQANEQETISGDDEAQSTKLANQMQRIDTTSQSQQAESTNQDTTQANQIEAVSGSRADQDDHSGSGQQVSDAAMESSPMAVTTESSSSQGGEPQLDVEALTDQGQAPAGQDAAMSGDQLAASDSGPSEHQDTGVRDIVMHDDYDDEVNPRSMISSPSKSTQAQEREEIAPEEASALEDEETQDTETNPSAPTLHATTASRVGTKDHDEMKDINGEVTSGSNIFEESAEESENSSGCSSGFGCFSGNGDNSRSDQEEGYSSLVSRSSIAKPPVNEQEQISDGSGQAMDSTSGSGASGGEETPNDLVSRSSIAKPPANEHERMGHAMDSTSGASGSEETANDLESRSSIVKPPTNEQELISDGSGEVVDSTSGSGASGSEETPNDLESRSSIAKPPLNEHVETSHGSGQSMDSTSVSGDDAPGSEQTPKDQTVSDSSSGHEPAKKQDHKIVGFGVTELDHSSAKLTFKDIDKDDNSHTSVSIDGEDEDEDEATSYSINDSSDNLISSSGEDVGSKSSTSDSTAKVAQNKKPPSSVSGDDIRNNSIEKEDRTMEDALIHDSKPSTSGSGNDVAKPHSNEKEDHSMEDALFELGKEVKAAKAKEQDKPEVVENPTSGKNQGVEVKEDKPEVIKVVNTTCGKNQAVEVKEDKPEVIKVVENSSSGKKKGNEVQEAKEDKPEVTKVVENPTSGTNKGIEVKEDKLEVTKVGEKPAFSEKNTKVKDLSSAKAKNRISQMEKIMKEAALKVAQMKEANAETRGDVPDAQGEEDHEEPVDTDIGKGSEVSLLLNQDYHHEYSEQDSMAYETLARNLKREIERVVGKDAVVSQISFSEAKSPGKTPGFSRVLAKFTLLGDQTILHNTIHGGFINNIAVDRKFFRSS